MKPFAFALIVSTILWIIVAVLLMERNDPTIEEMPNQKWESIE